MRIATTGFGPITERYCVPVPRLPLSLEPMLAQLQPGLPSGDGWRYEPKWDGFRVLAHRDGQRVDLVSRGGRPMTRYYPELIEPLRLVPAEYFVIDGEVVIAGSDGLDFDALLQRIHPAESRIKMLAEKTPAWFVAFDLVAVGDEDLTSKPLSERTVRLGELLAGSDTPIFTTPATQDRKLAAEWFDQFEGAGLDGVIAKRLDQTYTPAKRGWVKVKHERTADCVVIGYRLGKDGSLGSLLLGLFDDEGRMHYVGHTSSFSAAERRQLLEQLAPMREEIDWGKTALPEARMPGGPSRWSRGRESEWVSIKPELVCEVSYDKLQSGERFRHAATFRRWRPDKPPSECGFDQVFKAVRFELSDILAGARA
ncbi:MAG TPA: ATP-dependent DNA ligase [Candidatus Dormibacteraeota bacterium]